MEALIPAVFCPAIVMLLVFIIGKNSNSYPKHIQVSDNELFAYSMFLWLVFVIFGMNSLNSSGGLGISSQSEELLNLIAGTCVLLSEPAFLFINARIRKKHPAPLLIPYKTVRRYFSEEATQEEIETTIQQALKLYFAREE